MKYKLINKLIGLCVLFVVLFPESSKAYTPINSRFPDSFQLLYVEECFYHNSDRNWLYFSSKKSDSPIGMCKFHWNFKNIYLKVISKQEYYLRVQVADEKFTQSPTVFFTKHYPDNINVSFALEGGYYSAVVEPKRKYQFRSAEYDDESNKIFADMIILLFLNPASLVL